MNIRAAFAHALASSLFAAMLLAAPPEGAEATEADALFWKGSEAILAEDFSAAFESLSKAAAQAHAPSKAALGFLYFNGWGCEKDLQKARQLYEESAKAGAHQGLNNLAHLYRHGVAGVQKTCRKQSSFSKRRQISGTRQPTRWRIFTGKRTRSTGLKKCVSWLQFGAERNYPACLSDLGFVYQHGIAVPKDAQKAAQLYQKAIDAGSASAVSNLGYLYLQGEGVEKDPGKAFKLFEQSAKNGNAGGLMNLAFMRYKGIACDQDTQAALTLLKQAADQGSEQARSLLEAWSRDAGQVQK
ncbi:MAG: tetratricopeptide repeat protein [Verrucomicrobiales bacterium]